MDARGLVNGAPARAFGRYPYGRLAWRPLDNRGSWRRKGLGSAHLNVEWHRCQRTPASARVQSWRAEVLLTHRRARSADRKLDVHGRQSAVSEVKAGSCGKPI